jgi:hypothetical protein
LMFNKVTSRCYGYFLKFSYFFLVEKWILLVGQKLQKLVKKTEGILGVKTEPLMQVYPMDLNIQGSC